MKITIITKLWWLHLNLRCFFDYVELLNKLFGSRGRHLKAGRRHSDILQGIFFAKKRYISYLCIWLPFQFDAKQIKTPVLIDM